MHNIQESLTVYIMYKGCTVLYTWKTCTGDAAADYRRDAAYYLQRVPSTGKILHHILIDW
jgi:hypothetical protein